MQFVVVLTVCLFAINVFPQDKISIAVMELDGAGVQATDLQGLSDQLRTELFQTGKYKVIERSRMNDILKEQGFQQTGCTNTECAIEVGQLIGVSKIVVGSINKVGEIYSASIRIVDVGTGEIDKIASEHCEMCGIGDLLKVTLHNVARVLAGLDADKIVYKKIVQTQSVQQAVAPTNALAEMQEWERLGFQNREEWVNFKQSGLTIDQWKPIKSPSAAVFLSLVCPGAGLYYIGKGTGAFYTVGVTGLVVSGIALSVAGGKLEPIEGVHQNGTEWFYGGPGIESSPFSTEAEAEVAYQEQQDKSSRYITFGVVSIVVGSIAYIAGAIHAGVFTDRYNKSIPKSSAMQHLINQISLDGRYNPLTDNVRFSLTYNF